MKRLLVVLVVLTVAALAFADDALVLPTGVIRARVTGAYTMATQIFDADGKKDDIDLGFGVADSVNTINIGAAVEYGIVDGVNIALQWIPGYVLTSTVKSDTALVENAKFTGALDLFAGAKVQILGDDPVVKDLKNETMRFAAAAGVVVPFPGPDWKEQSDNLTADLTPPGADKDFITRDADNHAWGLGARAYYDYIINKMFFVNLYSEYIKFLKVDKESLASPTTKQEYDFGYRFTFEVEPHFEMPLSDKVELKTGVPVTWVTTPSTLIEDVNQRDGSNSLTVRPYASFFMTVLPLPIEAELGYLYPLAGKKAIANSAITLQLKAFAKF